MSPALFYRSLHGRHDWRGGTFKRALSAAKYVWRSLWMARRQSRWLSFLHESPGMAAFVSRDPRMHERAHHRYINRRLAPARRFKIIESHYRHVLGRFPSGLTEDIYIRGHASLGHLVLKDGSSAELRLSVPTGRGREGELALYLLQPDGQPLSSVIFTIADEGTSLLIGCLQGASGASGRAAVREFTKQAHGLRPKNLLLSMLYSLAGVYGISHVQGVSNRAHPFAGSDKIKADYDSFWQECRGVLLEDGFYRLPTHEPSRNEAEVESKNRSAFRKRELLRRQACELMTDALAIRIG
ncbi:MAG: DUF535 family protein [Rhodanobacter sp.]